MAVQTGAQVPQTRFHRDVVLSSGLHYQTWSPEGSPAIGEVSVPLALVYPVSRRLSLDLVTGSGSASLGEGAGSLSGLTDTKVRASYILGDEAALVTVGISAPTGKTGLTQEEQAVSSALAQGALNFRAPNFGQGLDVSLGLAVARQVGETVLGVGAGYLRKGEFTPSAGGAAYAPGSELSLTAGVDRRLRGGDGKLTVDAVYTLYGKDQQDGATVFAPGSKLLVQGLLALRGRGLEWRVHATGRLRGASERSQSGTTARITNGGQFEVGASLLKEVSPRWALRGVASAKAYADNVSELGALRVEQGEATILSAGPGVRLHLGTGRFLDITARYGTGKMDGASTSGIDVGTAVWLRL
ncbi:MAG: hypothetical protein AB1505_21085 [Candidatus Latescibacterota bacterium]